MFIFINICVSLMGVAPIQGIKLIIEAKRCPIKIQCEMLNTSPRVVKSGVT